MPINKHKVVELAGIVLAVFYVVGVVFIIFYTIWKLGLIPNC